MQKKLVLALLMMALLAGGAFAQVEFSAGFGGTFTADFMNYAWTDDGKKVLDLINMDTNYLDENHIGGGFFAYFDATYVMASLGMGFYGLTAANKDMQKILDDAKATISLTTLDIGLLGKYPIPLGTATLFPMLGVDFKIAIAHNQTVDGTKYTFGEDYSKDENLGDYYTSVWLKFGVGADIPLGEKLYLRPMFLYGIGTLPTKAKDAMDTLNDIIKTVDIIYHGLDIKLALGFKF
jgi:hypothetical protein